MRNQKKFGKNGPFFEKSFFRQDHKGPPLGVKNDGKFFFEFSVWEGVFRRAESESGVSFSFQTLENYLCPDFALENRQNRRFAPKSDENQKSAPTIILRIKSWSINVPFSGA